jgi:hypothetical protein
MKNIRKLSALQGNTKRVLQEVREKKPLKIGGHKFKSISDGP